MTCVWWARWQVWGGEAFSRACCVPSTFMPPSAAPPPPPTYEMLIHWPAPAAEWRRISHWARRPARILPNSQCHPVSADIAQYPNTGVVRTLFYSNTSSVMPWQVGPWAIYFLNGCLVRFVSFCIVYQIASYSVETVNEITHCWFPCYLDILRDTRWSWTAAQIWREQLEVWSCAEPTVFCWPRFHY